MKRTYIKPVMKLVECRPMKFVAASTDNTQWNYNTGGTDQNVDDETEPNPEGSRWLKENMWDE